MEYKEKVEYIDFIFKKIENSEMFSIDNIFFDSKLEDDDILDLVSFGEKYDLFEKTGEWFVLTPKGEKLKKSKKGFEKFENKENINPWYNENWVGYLIAVIVFLFTVYQYFENKTLSNQVFVLNKKNDSLIFRVDTYKKKYLELKENIEKNTE